MRSSNAELLREVTGRAHTTCKLLGLRVTPVRSRQA